MVTSPCKKCARREVGCHSKCEDYIKFRRELDKTNEVMHKENIKRVDYYSVREYGIFTNKSTREKVYHGKRGF